MKKLSAILIVITILVFETTAKSDQGEGISAAGALSSTLLLSSPNGGENLQGDGLCDINWVYNNISAVNLKYSTDNGVNWNIIADNVAASDSSCCWSVINLSSSNCLIKVIVASNPSVYDVSDDVFTIQSSTGLKNISEIIPSEYQLKNAYPNPFNPSVNIQYDLPERANIKLIIYNLLGIKIKTLVNEDQIRGVYTVNWNGKDEFGQQVVSGLYLYRFEAEGISHSYASTRRMILLK